MQTTLAYEEIKGVPVFDECPDDSWMDTESSYGEVIESRRAYHHTPYPLSERSKRIPEITLFAPESVFARPSLEEEFRELADRWRLETMDMSSTSSIITHFSYYQIISLGKDVIPLILRELQERGGQWYLALRVLTKDNPVNPEDAGNIKKMKKAWIDWGKERSLI